MASDSTHRAQSSIWSRINENDYFYPSGPLNGDNREIRLLHLMPGDHREQVFCTLETKSLYAQPEYEALSYTWGLALKPRSITVDHQLDFPVTDNLYAALTRLRRADEVRTLWVDAVCINQTDLTERSSQVAIMQHIYRGATSVLVWLGDAPLRAVPSRPCGEGQGTVCQSSTRQDGPDKYHSTTDALMATLRQTRQNWWERTWVVQEFVHAVREPVFCFEAQAMRLHSFVQTLQDSITEVDIATVPDDAATAANMGALFAALRYFQSVQGLLLTQSSTLIHAYARMSSLDASDPRDRLYSLRSMLMPVDAAVITPDYAKSVVDVFTRTTERAIMQWNSLQILSLASFGNTHTDGLPTWAADFSKRKPISLNTSTLNRDPDSEHKWPALFDGRFPLREPLSTFRDCSCCGPLLRGNGRYLQVEGVRFSAVNQAIKLPKHLHDVQQELATQPSEPGESVSCDNIVRQMLINAFGAPLNHPGVDLRELCNTYLESHQVCWDMFSPDVRTSTFSVEATELWRAAVFADLKGTPIRPEALLLAAWRQQDMEKTAMHRLAAWDQQDAEKTLMHTEAQTPEWLGYLGFSSQGQRLISMDEGSIGIGTSVVEEGDLVVLLDGTDTFAILHPTPDSCPDWGSCCVDTTGGPPSLYEFRGFAYVHGAMEGHVHRMLSKWHSSTKETYVLK